MVDNKQWNAITHYMRLSRGDASKEEAREKRHVRDVERRVGRFPRTFAVAWPPATMSDTLTPPWIADYLINIAETYGCSLSNVPIHVRPGKKVQLLQASREQ